MLLAPPKSLMTDADLSSDEISEGDVGDVSAESAPAALTCNDIDQSEASSFPDPTTSAISHQSKPSSIEPLDPSVITASSTSASAATLAVPIPPHEPSITNPQSGEGSSSSTTALAMATLPALLPSEVEAPAAMEGPSPGNLTPDFQVDTVVVCVLW